MSKVDLHKHITIIKTKLKQLQVVNKRIKLERPLSEKKISAIEKRYNIQLPEAYRLFLLEVGNGGSGPGYGLYSLREATVDNEWDFFEDHAQKPFLFNKSWLCDEEHAKLLGEEYLRATYGEKYKELIYNLPSNVDSFDGCIFLCHHGCATFSQLIITGEQRNNVWDNNDASGSGVWNTSKNFLEWYERWLDEELKYTDEKLSEIKDLEQKLINETKLNIFYYKIGEIYYRYLGDVEQADSFFNKALKLENLDTYQYRDIAAQKYEKQDQQTSICCAKKALELLKTDEGGNYQYKSELYQGIGQSYYVLKQFDIAIENFQKALHEVGEHDYRKCEELNFWIAKSYYEMKEPKKAIEYLEKSAQDKWTFNLFSNSYALLHDWNKCLTFNQKTTEIDSEWIVPRDNLGYYYSLMGKYDKAIKIHKEIIEEDSTYSWAYYNMAVAYALQNKVNKALPYLDKAIELGYDKEDIKNDKDIENLRNTEIYKRLIN